jgi:hypothetical protein
VYDLELYQGIKELQPFQTRFVSLGESLIKFGGLLILLGISFILYPYIQLGFLLLFSIHYFSKPNDSDYLILDYGVTSRVSYSDRYNDVYKADRNGETVFVEIEFIKPVD